MSLTINCSPQSYRRLEIDPQYRLTLTQQVLSEQESSFNEIIFAESPPESEPSNETTDGGKNYWSEAATKLMLSLMEEFRPKLGKSFHLKTKSKMYQLVSQKMGMEGHVFTPAQIENKFRGLERIYKKTVLHNRKTGRNRLTCSYESELHRILGEKKGINPEYVLDSGEVEGAPLSPEPPEETMDMEETSKEDDIQSSNEPKKKKIKTGARQQVADAMVELVSEKKKIYSTLDEYLKKKNERAERREQRAERKLELLEMLVKKQMSNDA